MHLFGRVREPNEMYGVTKDLLLCRASDDYVHKIGQDGGFVSALLIWAMDEGYIDCALTSFLEGDGTSWKAIPGLAAQQGGDPRLGRLPLHLLREHPRGEAGARRGLLEARARRA